MTTADFFPYRPNLQRDGMPATKRSHAVDSSKRAEAEFGNTDRFRRLLSLAGITLCLAGCAAQITRPGTDEAELVNAGRTRGQLIERLGAPLQTMDLLPPRLVADLGEEDRLVALLAPKKIAASQAVFLFKGRLDMKSRAVQASFDSFMTLGLAEVFLIPKALWEKFTDENLLLTAWFDADGWLVAYKWSPPQNP